MPNLLFWNLKNNKNEDIIAKCVMENDISIAAFCECKNTDFKEIEKRLNNNYQYIEPIRDKSDTKVRIIADTSLEVEIKLEKKRFTVFQVKSMIYDFILVVIHLEDRRNYTSMTRMNTITKLKSELECLEEELDCDKTIVIGDVNANPYDEEMISIFGFNAVLFKSIIESKDDRTFNEDKYKYFYNPILNFISEENEMIGSYYYGDGDATSYWYCLDQVLLRKSMIEYFEDMKYLRQIGGINLINRIIPNEDISDHLPLLVELREVVDDE